MNLRIGWLMLLSLTGFGCCLFGIIGCNGNDVDLLNGYIQRADGYYESSNFVNAEDQYRRALALDRNNVHVLGRLGTIYYTYYQDDLRNDDRKSALDHWTLAYNFFNEVLKSQPTNADAHIYLAELQLCVKNYAEGMNLLKKVLAFSSSDLYDKAKAHKWLAIFYTEQNDYKAAANELKEYLKLLPDAPDAEKIKQLIEQAEKEKSPPPER